MSGARTSVGRVILVRHGESEGNRDRVFTTTAAVPLTDRGRAQARAAAAAIRAVFRPERLVASPYARARETGEIIAAELGLVAELDDRFHEQCLGELAGRSYDVVAQDPSFDPARRWEWRPPGGESLEEVRRRVGPALAQLAAGHPEGDLVLVSHGGVMLALWAHVIGGWETARPSGNGGIVVVEHVRGRFRPPQYLDCGDTPGDAATLETGG